MSVEAIRIGDELLEGRIRDANAAFLGSVLAERGQTLQQVHFVRDDISAIVDALAATTADVVVISGGLGPTTDDLTREAAAAFDECELEFDDGAMERIRARFQARGREVTPNNRRQAMFPTSAVALATEVGTAPGFQLSRDGQEYFFFPGVPREFRWYVERHVCPRFDTRDAARCALLFHGLGESALETKIADITQSATASGLNVGYRAAYPVIEVKLAGTPTAVAAARGRIVERLQPWLVGEDDEGIAARVGRLLLERGETVTTAESCTAGGIAALITDVSGSSAWFDRGFVTYANQAKMDLVGVHDDVLLRHGAVSAQTVCQMASGARREARASYAVAVSGIAGPGGGTPDKPVGTVHFGLATESGTFHRHVHYRVSDRALVRAGTAYTALQMLLAFLEDRVDEAGNGPYPDAAVWAHQGVTI